MTNGKLLALLFLACLFCYWLGLFMRRAALWRLLHMKMNERTIRMEQLEDGMLSTASVIECVLTATHEDGCHCALCDRVVTRRELEQALFKAKPDSEYFTRQQKSEQ
jgi:hypothetical protein